MDDLLERLKPYAQGCFSGSVAEWPQLKPLLLEAFERIAELEAELSDERLDREGLILTIEENRELKDRIAELTSVLMTEQEHIDLLSKEHYRDRIAELEAERDRLLAIVSKLADVQGLGYEAFGDAIYDLILEAKAALAANGR